MLYVYLDNYICIFSVKKLNYNVNPILLFMLSYVDVYCVHLFGLPIEIQLGARYEGQLNSKAEPIFHVIRSLVRTHVYHPYFAADRQSETDSCNFERRENVQFEAKGVL